jgi:hypothetical protein
MERRRVQVLQSTAGDEVENNEEGDGEYDEDDVYEDSSSNRPGRTDYPQEACEHIPSMRPESLKVKAQSSSAVNVDGAGGDYAFKSQVRCVLRKIRNSGSNSFLNPGNTRLKSRITVLLESIEVSHAGENRG